jgi:hypothetical protein
MKAATAHLSAAGSMNSANALKAVLQEVQRDEAEAISILAILLDKVHETSHTAALKDISKVVLEWQNQPPRGIVTSLLRICEGMECRARNKK